MTRRHALVTGPLLLPALIAAAAHAGAVFYDDFNRADSSTLGNGWIEAGTHGQDPSVSSNLLLLPTVNTSGAPGNVRAYQDTHTPAWSAYSPVLSQNGQLIQWSFNMRQTNANPVGFGVTGYGVAFVLGGTDSDFLEGSGYAVLLGQSGTNDFLRLVRYTNGLDGGGPVNLITGTTDFADEYLSVRVTYDPATNRWTLYASGNTVAFADPLGEMNLVGTVINATHVNTDLRYMGLFWSHFANSAAGASANFAQFDNILVYVPEPTCGGAALVLGIAGMLRRRLDWSLK